VQREPLVALTIEVSGMTDKLEEKTAECDSQLDMLVMCGWSNGGKQVLETNVFETSTGALCYCCEQHTNIALTCMKHLRKLNT